jgi:hypothetical protein
MTIESFKSLIMKRFFIGLALILGIFFSRPSCAQEYMLPVNAETGQVSYSSVQDVKNDKLALFKNAQTWVATTFGDYKSVVQFEDKEAGKLILKGQSPLKSILQDRIRFKVAIDVKDNKYRVVIDDLEAQTVGIWTPVSNIMVADAQKKIDSLQTTVAGARGKQKKEILSDINVYQLAIACNAEIAGIVQGMISTLKTQMVKNDDY